MAECADSDQDQPGDAAPVATSAGNARKDVPVPLQSLQGAAGSWWARLRAVMGVLLLLAMASVVWAFGYWEPRLLPIRVIEVTGELHHHSSRLLEDIIGQRLRGGILTADLGDLKSAAESLPWVGRASLRRVWPDRLQVQIEERRPIARWNTDQLITAEGVVFHPGAGLIPAGLPVLEGDDQHAKEVVRRYQQWRDELMRAGHLIQALSVDARGDWRIKLVMGTDLRLGTTAVEERLARFIASAPQLEAAGQPLAVDLRYSNGFAVKWAPGTDSVDRAHTDRSARSGNRG